MLDRYSPRQGFLVQPWAQVSRRCSQTLSPGARCVCFSSILIAVQKLLHTHPTTQAGAMFFTVATTDTDTVVHASLHFPIAHLGLILYILQAHNNQHNSNAPKLLFGVLHPTTSNKPSSPHMPTFLASACTTLTTTMLPAMCAYPPQATLSWPLHTQKAMLLATHAALAPLTTHAHAASHQRTVLHVPAICRSAAAAGGGHGGNHGIEQQQREMVGNGNQHAKGNTQPNDKGGAMNTHNDGGRASAHHPQQEEQLVLLDPPTTAARDPVIVRWLETLAIQWTRTLQDALHAQGLAHHGQHSTAQHTTGSHAQGLAHHRQHSTAQRTASVSDEGRVKQGVWGEGHGGVLGALHQWRHRATDLGAVVGQLQSAGMGRGCMGATVGGECMAKSRYK